MGEQNDAADCAGADLDAVSQEASDTLARDPLPAQSRVDECPSCSEPCGTPSLLTSMVRYYVCGRCARRWQVGRDRDLITIPRIVAPDTTEERRDEQEEVKSVRVSEYAR